MTFLCSIVSRAIDKMVKLSRHSNIEFVRKVEIKKKLKKLGLTLNRLF